MKFTIITIGSAGDIYPCIALGQGLKAKGHKVSIVTHGDFEAQITHLKLDFKNIQFYVRNNPESDIASKWRNSGGNPFIFIKEFAKLINPTINGMMDAGLDASKDADAIIGFGFGIFIALQIAEKINKPIIQAYSQPIHPTKAFPFYLISQNINWGKLFNYYSYDLLWRMLWSAIGISINQARKDVLHLSCTSFESQSQRINSGTIPTIYSFSPSLIPKPTDWGENTFVTGYWYFDNHQRWSPPSALIDFINSGPLPLYIGFGSMKNKRTDLTTELIISALDKSKQRAVLATGWGGIAPKQNTEKYFFLEEVSHNWLFPHMKLAIHHGGSGTTFTALKTGIPSIIVPFMGDQFFWGSLLFKRGLGTKPIPQKRLSSDRLFNEILSTNNNIRFRANCTSISRKIELEDSVFQAVNIIENVSQRPFPNT